MLKLNNFFTSNWIFSDDDWTLKSRYQMLNIGLIMSSLALIYGIIINTIRNIPSIIPIDILVLSINISLFFMLRKYKNFLNLATIILTTQVSFLFLWLIYTNDPYELKHVWLFTFPIIMLFFQNKITGIYWVLFMVVMLNLAPFQNIFVVQYTHFQLVYLSVALVVVSIIIYFYQHKMDEARGLILEQQIMLKSVNIELAKQVEELKFRDKLLTTQSKQAVMGEMISMIAHQWRQPLSTVTLQIASLKIQKELGHKIDMQDVDRVLDDISDKIIYLSDTIDDFQTYFHPNKEKSEIETYELIHRVINFSEPRFKGTKIKVEVPQNEGIVICTYINELVQVLLNIVNNAADALIQDKINEPRIYIRIEETNKNSLKIEIADNAKGINDNTMKQLFEPYFSTKGKNGTGLGLYMSEMIMQKQFGTHIDVKTSEYGTMFSVEIPVDIRL